MNIEIKLIRYQIDKKNLGIKCETHTKSYINKKKKKNEKGKRKMNFIYDKHPKVWGQPGEAAGQPRRRRKHKHMLTWLST